MPRIDLLIDGAIPGVWGRCPVCDGAHFLRWRQGLVRCQACGLVVSPVIWQLGANEQMEDEWFGDDPDLKRTSFWVDWFESLNSRKTLARLNSAGAVGLRLLEIGVGSGSFLYAAREQGYEVWGCDLSEGICKRVRDQGDVIMCCGPLSTLAGNGRFDVIVMNHILEHVQSPREFMKDVVRLLAPNGLVHVAVPNVGCWQAQLSGWTSYEPYHLSYFDPRTLRCLLEGAALNIEQLATRDAFSGWFLAIVRTLLGVNRIGGAVSRPVARQTVRGRRGRSVFVEHAYRLAMVLSGLALWPIRWLQGRIGRGDEIICLARKPPLPAASTR